MDYSDFLKNNKEFIDWNESEGFIDFYSEVQAAQSVEGFYGAPDVVVFGTPEDDRVNSPSHYTAGTQEAIDIIEEAIEAAPSNSFGMLQAQVLKYMLRLWLKDNPAEDAKKAQWYLTRLIEKMS